MPTELKHKGRWANRERFLKNALLKGGQVYEEALEYFGRHPNETIESIYSYALSKANVNKNELSWQQKITLLNDLRKRKITWDTIRKKPTVVLNSALFDILRQNKIRVSNKKWVMELPAGKGLLILDDYKAKVGPFGYTIFLNDLAFKTIVGSLEGWYGKDFRRGIVFANFIELTRSAPAQIIPISFIRTTEFPKSKLAMQRGKLLQETDIALQEIKVAETHEDIHKKWMSSIAAARKVSCKEKVISYFIGEIAGELDLHGVANSGSIEEALSQLHKLQELEGRDKITKKELEYYTDFHKLVNEAVGAGIPKNAIVSLIVKTRPNHLKQKLNRLINVHKETKSRK